jgi:probable rRNA maturation factor
MEISIRNRQRAIKTDPARIEKILLAALRHLSAGNKVKGRNLASGLSFDPAEASVGVLLVTDSAMRDLNRIYRGKDRTTDVLSFSQLEGAVCQSHTPELGDIVISPAQALRQAEERGTTLGPEMEQLLIHGLLHLVGYDHEKNSYQARKMRAMEKELFLAVKKMGRQRQ